jgi:branched-chain amino acid aminotransferase
MTVVAWVNGRKVGEDGIGISVTDPAFTLGWAVFETLTGDHGGASYVDDHLDRLARSCELAGICAPNRDQLQLEIERAARASTGPCRLRITVSVSGVRVVLVEPLDVGRRHQPVSAVRGTHLDDPYMPGSVKHTSRAGWMAAVRRAGVDEMLLVDDSGRFTEGTTSGIIAIVGGVLYTHPQDGRILESTTVKRVVERARYIGVEVRWEGPSSVGPWDALYIASVSRDLAPVISLDGEPLAGWDPVGRRLIEASLM